MEMLSLKQEDFSWNHSAGICLAAHFLLFVPQTPKSKSKPSQRLKQGNISRGHQAKTKGSFIFFTVRIGWHVTGMAPQLAVLCYYLLLKMVSEAGLRPLHRLLQWWA